MSTTAVTTEASVRRATWFGWAVVIMALTIAGFQEKASQKEFLAVLPRVDFLEEWAMVGGSPASQSRGSESHVG
jgi:hypothetical protein